MHCFFKYGTKIFQTWRCFHHLVGCAAYCVTYCAACCAALTIASPAYPLTLTESLALARKTDPQLLSAQANHSASLERSKQVFGALLPQLSASINKGANQRNYETKKATSDSADDSYSSNSRQLNLTQHVWHSASRVAVNQANAAAAQAAFQLALAEQDLRLRLAIAWFDVMHAQDVNAFSLQQTNANKNQWEQARRAAGNGLVSIPVLEEARTKYDQAVADQSSAENELHSKLSALEQITGWLPSSPPMALSTDYPAPDPRSQSLEQWLKKADLNHPAVLAASNGLEAANEEVNKQSAGHEPTVEATASYARNAQNVGSFPGQNGYLIRQWTIGLQLTIPLYSGGTQKAKVGEAEALRDKAMHDVEAARRNTKLSLKQAWFAWHAGFARQTAALQSHKFTTLALQAARKGKTSGVKTELDVLQAQQQLSNALKDLQKSRYDMITNYLKLKSTQGELTDTDLTTLEPWFISN